MSIVFPDCDPKTTKSRRVSLLSALFVAPVLGVSMAIAASNPIELFDVDGVLAAQLGYSVCAVPDVNGDGKWDVAAGSRNIQTYEGPADSGKVTIFDGVTGTKLGTLFPFYSVQGSNFGDSISGVPDTDGEGFGDVIVGDGAKAFIYDGKRHIVLQILYPSSPYSTGFGDAVAGLSDVDGDGFGDVIVGARYEISKGGLTQAGRVYVFSGHTGALIYSRDSPNAEAHSYFGHRVSSVPDVNGDGKQDVLVASYETPADKPINSGRVYLFDGMTSGLLCTFTSPNGEYGGGFGLGLCAIPDMNGDGKGDVLIGAPWESIGSISEAGRVYLYDGVTGNLLHIFLSPNKQERGGFGDSVASIPEVNEDGHSELLISAPGEAGDSGYVYLFDGVTGRLLRVFTSPHARYSGAFGCAVAALSDVNADGRGDAIIGAYGESVPPQQASWYGRAYIFHLEPGPPASVGINWTLYDSAPGSLGFRAGESGVAAPLPVK